MSKSPSLPEDGAPCDGCGKLRRGAFAPGLCWNCAAERKVDELLDESLPDDEGTIKMPKYEDTQQPRPTRKAVETMIQQLETQMEGYGDD